MRRNAIARLTLGIAAVAALVAASSASAATVEVRIRNAAFTPSAVTVQPNDTVVFFNDDAFTHDVIFSAGFGTGTANLTAGQNWSHTFSTAGSFPFHCSLHSSMTGTVTVGTVTAPPPKAPGFELPAVLGAIAAIAFVARRRRAL